MASFSSPTTGSLYSAMLAEIRAIVAAVAIWQDSRNAANTNIPTNAKRWNNTSLNFENYTGSAWAPLAATYGFNISGSAGSAAAGSGSTFFTAASTSEGQIGCKFTGKPDVYLYNTSAGWGVYSAEGGAAFAYNRVSATFTFNGKATTCITADTVAANGVGTTQLANASVTLAKMANLATTKLIGRSTAGTGVPEAISIGTGLSLSGGTLSCTVSSAVASVFGRTGVVELLTTDISALTYGIGSVPHYLFGGDLSSSAVTTYTEIVNYRVVLGGTYRFAYTQEGQTSGTFYTRIYKNGVAYGIEHTSSGTTALNVTEDLLFATGDTVQIFVKSPTYGSGMYVSELRLLLDTLSPLNIFTSIPIGAR